MFQKHTHNLRKYMYKFLFCFVLLFIRNEDTFVIIFFQSPLRRHLETKQYNNSHVFYLEVVIKNTGSPLLSTRYSPHTDPRILSGI